MAKVLLRFTCSLGVMVGVMVRANTVLGSGEA